MPSTNSHKSSSALSREARAAKLNPNPEEVKRADIDVINANLAAIQAMAVLGEEAATLAENLFSQYMATIQRLAKEADDHANALYHDNNPEGRAKAMILTRDLRERLYTLCYYVQPDKPVEGGNPTKAQAKAAADGILEVATQIEALLGVNRG